MNIKKIITRGDIKVFIEMTVSTAAFIGMAVLFSLFSFFVGNYFANTYSESRVGIGGLGYLLSLGMPIVGWFLILLVALALIIYFLVTIFVFFAVILKFITKGKKDLRQNFRNYLLSRRVEPLERNRTLREK
jgi:uncharacterized membrane protein